MGSFQGRLKKNKRSSGPSPTIPSPYSKLLKASVSKLEGTEHFFAWKAESCPQPLVMVAVLTT